MADKATFRLTNKDQSKNAFTECYKRAQEIISLGKVVVLEMRGETRSEAQNRHMWPCLTDISEQVDWYGHKLSPQEWKDLLTASLKKQKVVQGIDGNLVMVGASTSKMTKAEFAELQELILAFGTQQGVNFRVDD